MSETPSLLEQSAARACWSLAWPTILLGFLRSGYFLANSFWVSNLGSSALAAIGGCAFASWILYALMDLVAVGVYARVAQAVGAGDRLQARRLLGLGLCMAVGLGLLLSWGVWASADLYLRTQGLVAPEAYAAARAYLEASAWGCLPITLFNLLAASFRAMGNARAPLWMYGLTLVLNAVIDPWLIYGGGGFEGMGVAGAAVATAISHVLGVLLSLWLLARADFLPVWGGLRWHWVPNILSIGAPIAASGAGFSLVYVFLGREINRYGPEAMAGVGLGHRLESLVFLICLGFQVAATTLVGQWVGAGQPERAAAAAREIRRQLILVIGPASILLMVLAVPLLSLFTTDPAVLEVGRFYVYLTGSVAILMGFEVMYEGAFSGTGKTLVPLLIAFPLTAARVPVAIWLGSWTTWGVVNVFVAIACSTFLKGLLMWFFFERGGWRRPLASSESTSGA